jgi:hypothetical protein
MYSQTFINEELTKETFGYTSERLTKGSWALVIVECTNCHRLVEKPYKSSFSRHSCPIVEGNNKRCFKCKEWKDLSLFNKAPKLSGGVAKMCRECYNNHEAVKRCGKNRASRKIKSFKEDIAFYIKTRAYSIRSRCNQQKVPYDIDAEYLYELWNLQQGRCYYSNLEMKSEGKVHGFQSWFSPSVDRKDPTLGYIKGNVVWCCSCVNSFKQTMTTEEFVTMLKDIKWDFEEMKETNILDL